MSREIKDDEFHFGANHLTQEGQLLDRKSLRAVAGKSADRAGDDS